MAKYEISHPELPQLKGILELEDGVQPSEKHFWEAAKTMVRPYGASQLSDNAKIAAYKNGFFDTPSAPILDVEDNPDTLQNEEQPGLLSSLGDMVSKLGTRIDPLTSPYSKVVQLEDKPVAYQNTENLEQFREAGKRLFGLLDNQQSLSELGFDPISEALKQTGMPFYAKNADARGRVKAAAMDYATDNIKASVGMGTVRAWKTPEFLLKGGSYLANKINLDEEDDQEILEYVNSAIGFDKVNYEYETAADLAAWVMDNPIDAIKGTVGVEPKSMSFDSQLEQDIRSGYQEPSEGVGLAFEIALDPFNAAGAPLAKGVTAPMRIGLKGRMLKTIKDVQQKTTELAKYQNILRKLPEDALVRGRVVQQIERVAGELTEQQKILQKYGSNSLHLRLMGKASPETLGKVAMETFDQSTDAGKMGMSLVQEATKASDKMSKLRRVANTAAKFNPEIAGATVGGLMFGPVGATIGASIPTVLKVARFISTMPENVATRYIITAAQNAGEEITEQAARQRYRNYKNLVGTGLGLGSAAGFALDQDALGGTGGIAALSVLLGPQALSLFDNIARDARVVGSELTLARTGDHTPFFRRLAMLPTPDQGLAGATMDKFNILMRPGPEGLLNRGFDAIVQGGKASGKEVFPSKQAFRVGSQGEKIGQASTISKGTQKFANFMDNAGALGRLGTPAESLGRFAKGMAIGSTIPASIGYVASGGQASGAVAGTIMSAPFTALGTGAGMYQNYKTKGDLYAKQIGDIQYYREHLNKQERADFDALPAHIRAQVAGYSLSHPDVVFKQTTEGEGGFNPVTMEVSYNPNGSGYLKGTMAHEITHFIEVHGLTPMVNRILFGDKETRTAGEFASYDSDGNIVYTDEFLELRDIYMDRLRKDTSLDPDAVAEYEANPQKIGREIFADQGTDYLLSGKREKSLNQGPVGKLLQETLNGITGVSFLRDFLLKLNLPLNAEGKFITSTDLFKGKLRKIPELQNLIDKYYKDVRGLKKAQIEGSEFTDPFTGTTRKQEGSKPIDTEFETLYTVEDQKNPNVVDKLNTGGIYKTNPQTGEVEKDALGNPIRMTKGEADKVSKAAGDHASEVFKKNGIEVETNDKGQPFVKDLPALTEEIIDQLARGPIHPRQIATLREISRALRQGDGERAGMLIGYYAASQGRKPKAVPFAVRTTMPYGFELTAQGNILVRIHDVDQIQKNLQFLKGERQPKKLPKELVGMYDELFGNDNAVWDAFALYRQNTANGIDGRTGLDTDPVIANKKLNFLNALHGGITKSQVAMNPVLNAIGYQMAGINKKSNPFGPATKTFRLDRVFNAQRSGRASPVNEQRVINLMSPQGQKLYTPKPEADVQITDKLFMPMSKEETIFAEVMSDSKFKSDTKRRAEMIRRGVPQDRDFLELGQEVRKKLGIAPYESIKDAYKAQSQDKLFMPASEAGAGKGKQAEAAKLWQEKGTDSPYFKKWFGKSKVVDENGKPLVVYHGTDKDIKSFDIDAGMKTEEGHGSAALGTFFTADPQVANVYTGQMKKSKGIGGNIMPVYLKIQNPYLMPIQEMMGLSSVDAGKAKRVELIKKGFDGIIQKEPSGKNTKVQIVAFKPEQIKSATGNRGTFDAGERNILFMPASELKKEFGVKQSEEIQYKRLFMPTSKDGEDYRGFHHAPDRDNGSPLHDVTGMYPSDIYGPNGARYYGTGDSAMDAKSIAIIQEMYGNPDGEVTIYRAVPKFANEIRPNDWVTIIREYAELHGESGNAGGDGYKILTKKVKASELFTEANSLHEWGWSPEDKSSKQFMPASEAGAGKGKVPKTGDMLTLDDKSLKLFLPSPGNPNASLSDFKGKNVQVLTTDLSMVGDKKIDGATVAFTGGPGYLSVNDAWGFTNEGSAKAFKTRWERDDKPLIGLTSMKQDNHKASTLTREYYVRKFMQAINQGKISESLVNEHIIEALTRAAKGKGLTDSQKRALLSVKNIEDFLRIFSNGQIIPWKATPKIYDRLSQATLPIKQGKLKELGLDLDTILRETRQKEYNDIKKGSLLAIAEYDGSDAVYRPDLNSAYPWSIPLKEKAFLKDFADIQDLSSRQDLRGSDGDANMAVAMGAGVMLDRLSRGDVNFMPSGRPTRQPANRITRQAPAMPGNRFMLPAVSAGAKSAERFR